MKAILDNEGVRAESFLACYLCGRPGKLLNTNLRDQLFGVPGVWNFRRCPFCQLVWLDPRPVPEDIGKIYTQYHTHTVADPQPDRLPRARAGVKRSIWAAAFGYENAQMDGMGRAAGWILSRLGSLRDIAGGNRAWLETRRGGSLLDVGCGNGQFLAQMRELGWKVLGVDTDPVAVETARGSYGLNVTCGRLEEAGFPKDTFDAVTLIHVLEHLFDPIGTLRECRRVLRKGGRLVVVTPNIESLGCHWFGRAWRGLEAPRHMFLFSSQALRQCVVSAGLRIRELRTTARLARFIWHCSRLLRRDGQLAGGSPPRVPWHLRLEGILFWVGEHLMTKAGPWGEEILMIATKET